MTRSRLVTILLLSAAWLNINTLSAQKTLTLQPGPGNGGYAAYIIDFMPTYNQGEPDVFLACYWTFQGIPGVGRSLMRFDLSEIPPGSEIFSATLSLYYYPGVNGGNGGDNACWLKRVGEPWDPDLVTWATQPVTVEAGQVEIPAAPSFTNFPDIDLKDFTELWVNDPSSNHGMMLKLQNESVIYTCMLLGASYAPDPAVRPKLVVVYRDCPQLLGGFAHTVDYPVVYFHDTTSASIAWHWDFGDGYGSTLKDPVHSYSQSGIYPVCLVVSDSCSTDTICKEVDVCSTPIASFAYLAEDHTVAFSDSSVGALTWSWDFGDGFFSDLQNPVHFFNDHGTYYVCLNVSNTCSNVSFCDSVSVFPDGIPGEDRRAHFSLYPNPTHGTIYLTCPESLQGMVNIDLIAPDGRLMRQYEFAYPVPGQLYPLDLGRLAAGCYLARIRNHDRNQTFKVDVVVE